MEYIDEVINALDRIGIRAAEGFPAAWAPALGDVAAAVTGSGLDSDKGTAQVTVGILCPRARGLRQCQNHAAMALGALVKLGSGWHCSGWQFRDNLDCYLVEVVGDIPVVFSGTDLVPGRGWQVAVGETALSHVTDFLARWQGDRRLIRPHGTAEPFGVTPGMDGWSIRLTQLIPLDENEPVDTAEPFTLTVSHGSKRQVYRNCCWSEMSCRKQTGGTLVVRSGFAVSREVS